MENLLKLGEFLLYVWGLLVIFGYIIHFKWKRYSQVKRILPEWEFHPSLKPKDYERKSEW